MKKWLAIHYHRHGWELEREDEYLDYYDITNVEFDRLVA